MSPDEYVNKLQQKGYNCTQIVLLFFAEKYGLDESIALKISQGFAKGMYIGSNCGVRSGAYMVLGLAYGNSDKQVLKTKINEFNNEFKKLSIYDDCDDILQYNLLYVNRLIS